MLWRPGVTLEFMRERMRDTLSEHVGIELVEMGGRCPKAPP
ncbi:MAG TPA: hypothetical protein VFO94_13585 [Gammaproteobacteria bacterium]|nr:hypothetical protein [Gammaproteobacteria bacterium]